jgi:peptidoglycan/xylan/chitin deacetylase (PgdA/CDA1 family)
MTTAVSCLRGKLLGVATLLVTLGAAISCARTENPVGPKTEPPPVETALIPDDGAVRVGETTRIHLFTLTDTTATRVVHWSSDRGQILGDDESASFTAPSEPGAATIKGLAVEEGADTVELILRLPVYRQWVVLKADDLTQSNGAVIPGFLRLFSFLDEQEIVAAVGIIGNSLDRIRPAYITALRSELQSGRIEIFSHGYDHSGNTIGSNGRPAFEFQNTPLDQQIDHLLQTQRLVRSQLGVTVRAFGAPYNAIDSVTVEALRAVPELEVWFFGLPGSGKLNLLRVAEAEYPTHYPDAAQFAANYNPALPIITLQIHPGGWEDKSWKEFTEIVQFLKQRQASFVLPSDLYGYLHPDAATYLAPPKEPRVGQQEFAPARFAK